MDVIKTHRGSERRDRFRFCLCLAFSVGGSGGPQPEIPKKFVLEECIDHVFVDLGPRG